jgi:chromosome segregation ATPase
LLPLSVCSSLTEEVSTAKESLARAAVVHQAQVQLLEDKIAAVEASNEELSSALASVNAALSDARDQVELLEAKNAEVVAKLTLAQVTATWVI